MSPEVGLLAVTAVNWPTFRATMDKALKLRPDIDINNIPLNLSNDALVLLNIAAFYGWSLNNPLNVLRNIPPGFMECLSYQFFIACDELTWDEFNPSSNITVIKRKLTDGILLIASGTLSGWYQTIVNNLGRDWSFQQNTRILFCKIMLTLERERGLGIIFEKYKKRVQKDYTFLLERK